MICTLKKPSQNKLNGYHCSSILSHIKILVNIVWALLVIPQILGIHIVPICTWIVKTKDSIVSRVEYQINDNSKATMVLSYDWNYKVYHYRNQYPEVLFAEILQSSPHVKVLRSLQRYLTLFSLPTMQNKLVFTVHVHMANNQFGQVEDISWDNDIIVNLNHLQRKVLPRIKCGIADNRFGMIVIPLLGIRIQEKRSNIRYA